MKSNIIKLSWAEVIQSALSGVMRRVSSRKNHLHDNSKKGTSGWNNDIVGNLGETAFAKYANLYNSFSINSFKLPDIGHVQVRSTTCPNGHLIIAQNDNENDPYVLMIGEYEEWEIKGWITGKQAKHPQFWNKQNSNYWVPIDQLEDISTLPMETK